MTISEEMKGYRASIAKEVGLTSRKLLSDVKAIAWDCELLLRDGLPSPKMPELLMAMCRAYMRGHNIRPRIGRHRDVRKRLMIAMFMTLVIYEYQTADNWVYPTICACGWDNMFKWTNKDMQNQTQWQSEIDNIIVSKGWFDIEGDKNSN